MEEKKMQPVGPGGPGGPGGPPAAGYAEKKLPTDWIVSETMTVPNGLILREGSLPAAPDGLALLMTVDDVVTEIAPGVYPGRVQLTVYRLSHIPDTQAEFTHGDFRTALYVKNGVVQDTPLAFTAGEPVKEPGRLSHARLQTKISDFNGIMIDADTPETPFVLSDCEFFYDGSGTSEGRGACVTTVGQADVRMEHLKFWNRGSASAIIASGQSRVQVCDSVIYGRRDFSQRMLCPWVLGINGNNRLTNAIDHAQVHYQDSIVVAESWAALSTDTGKAVRLTGERLFAGIGRLEDYNPAHAEQYTATPSVHGQTYGFTLGNSAIGESGYVNYADAGFHNSFRDVEFWSPDYIFILSTRQASIDVSGDSKCWSGRVGVLWHKNSGGTVHLRGGRWYAKNTLFLCKSYSETDTIGCWSHSICDGTEIALGEGGVLYQLMTSDDVGLRGPSRYTVPEVEQDWSLVQKLPETYRAQKMFEVNPIRKFPIYLLRGEEVVVKDDVETFLAANPDAVPAMYDAPYRLTPTEVEFRNLKASGDLFNGVYARIQELSVTLDHAEITGTISSAHTFHVDALGVPLAAGTTISQDGPMDAHLGIGRVGNIPAAPVNNPVRLVLRREAVWHVTGPSYLSALEIDDTSRIIGTVTVNGTKISGAGSYEGDILACP